MNVENIKPNLFLIGAPKAGTSAVANTLSLHPEIYLSERKEPRFFDAPVFYDYPEDYPIKSVEQYLSLFEGGRGLKYRLDASVFNMYSKQSIAEILKFNPKSKFILIVRDPVEASVSMHKQRLKYIEQSMRELSSNFMDCWNLLESRRMGEGFPRGCRNRFIFRYDLLYSYENYIPDLVKLIPQEQLNISFYQDLKIKHNDFYAKIFKFLGLENYPVSNRVVNSSEIVRSDPITRSLLKLSRYGYKFVRRFDKGKVLKKKAMGFFYPGVNTIKCDSFADESVHHFFSKTRNYLDSLKN